MRNLTIDLPNIRMRNRSDAVRRMYGSHGDGSCGVFQIRSPTDGALLTVVASDGEGWEHVSVSRANRCPNWPEMQHAKELFFRDCETVMQLHVPKDEHIDQCSTCLHLWRPIEDEIPRPPSWMVGMD